jgi:hypothetical protein
LKRTFHGGLQVKSVLLQAYVSAREAIVDHGPRAESAVFVRINIPADTYQFYFTPEAVRLIGPFVASLGAIACEIPARRSPTRDRYGALALLVGDAEAWHLLE